MNSDFYEEFGKRGGGLTILLRTHRISEYQSTAGSCTFPLSGDIFEECGPDEGLTGGVNAGRQ